MVLKLSDPLLNLRNITSGDEESLYRIYSSTRSDELAQLTNWTLTQKESFLRSQFNAQHTYYQNNYKGAEFLIIEYRSHTIGRLYLHPNYEGGSIRVIDISLLPEWRKQGIGKLVISSILNLAATLHRSVTLHVESFNPAMNFYNKLGFELVSQTNGVYHLLEWKTKTEPLQQKLLIKQSEECRQHYNF